MNCNFTNNLSEKIFIGIIPLLLIPFAGMFALQNSQTIENRQLVELPYILKDYSLNKDYLSELGQFFNDHYAFRSELITLDTQINATLFNTSNVNNVILGQDGWLFYKDTLAQYQNSPEITDKQLECIAYNISVVQNYVNGLGMNFLFTSPPNKNSIYPQYMQERYLESASPHALERLKPFLQKYNVNYLDLFLELKNSANASEAELPLYYERDTHWNGYGQVIGCNSIFKALNRASVDVYNFSDCGWGEHIGDLESMLFPSLKEGIYSPVKVCPTESVTNYFSSENKIISKYNSMGEGVLYSFNDSFVAPIREPLSGLYSSSEFQNSFQWDLSYLISSSNSDVLLERVERNIALFNLSAPYFYSYNADRSAEIEEILSQNVNKEMCEDSLLPRIERVESEATGNSYLKFSGTFSKPLVINTAKVYAEVSDPSTGNTYYCDTYRYFDSGSDGFYFFFDPSLLESDEYTVSVWQEFDNQIENIFLQSVKYGR